MTHKKTMQERMGLSLILSDKRLPSQFGNRHTRLSTALKLLGFPSSQLKELRSLPNDELEYRVREQYLEKARQYHPDLAGDNEYFKQITYAYHIIKKRLNYPRAGLEGYIDAMRFADVRF
jgi:hypothetical protein